jgi:hypothetical protein
VKIWKVAKRGELCRAWRSASEIESLSKQDSGGLPASFQAQFGVGSTGDTFKPASRGVFARLGRGLALATSAVFFFSNVAVAESSNSIRFSCKDGYTGYLCKAGKDSHVPCTGSGANTADNLKISGVTAGSLINFSFSSVNGTVSTDVQVKGSGSQTGDPTPSSGTAPVAMSYTVTSQDASDSESDFQVTLTNNSIGKDETAAANYTVSCKPATGSVTLRKTTQDGGTNLSSFASSDFALQLTPQGGQTITKTVSMTSFTTAAKPPITDLPAGTTYTFSEGALPAGPNGTQWLNTSLACTDGNTSLGSSFTLQPNQIVTCTATNKLVQQTGTVSLVKVTQDGGTNLSSFASTPFTLQLTPQGGQTVTKTVPMTNFGPSPAQAIQNLPAGTEYSFAEGALPEGPTGTQWQQVSLACTDGNSQLGSSFTLQPNQNVTCTATNKLASLPGSITIVKAVSGGANVPFSFQWTNTNGQLLSNFSLTPSGGTASSSVNNLPAGTYAIQENVASGWKLTSIACSGATAQTAGSQATITLGGGQDASCTFTNQQQNGTLKVVKTAIGGDDNFSFTANGNSFTLRNGEQKSFTLPVGNYTVSENSLPNGWKLQGATCSQGGSLNGNTIQATLTDNATTTCTFTNFKQKDDRAEDVTKLFVHRRVDNLLSNQPDRARIIRRLDGAPAASLKDGGSYSEPFDNASPVPGGLKDPVRSDLSRLQGRTSDAGSSSIGSVKVSMSLSQAAAEAQASEKKKLADAGLSFGDTPYGYSVPVLQPRFDMWMEAHVSKYTESLGGINREGDFNILYVGGDYVIRPGLLIGALAQIDRTVEDVRNPDLLGKISGAGWMAGPYAGAKLSDHLYFDARAAWGKSSNSLWLQDSIVGYRTGAFNTDRWLATTGLTGNYQFGLFRVSPQIELAYGSESADAYKTSLNQSVDKVSATIGRMSFGPEFGYTSRLDNGVTIEPQFSVKGIWNFDDAPIALSTGTVRAAPLRAEVETGVMIKMPSGFSVRASGSYDGIGDKNLEVWTTKGWINFPLN